jgi:hypothetical protein
MQNQEVCTSEGGRIEGARYDLQGEEVVQEVRTRQPVSSITGLMLNLARVVAASALSKKVFINEP